MLVIALVVLPIIVVFGFSGCVGDDPERIEQLEREKKDIENKLNEEKQKAEEAAKQIEKEKADTEARKYHNVVKAELNLVSHWRLSEGETGNAVAIDSAPDMPMNGEYKNTAGVVRNVQGALALVADPNDKATEFDGAQGYVEVPYHILVNPPLDFSIEAWINPTAATADPNVVAGSYEIENGKMVRGYLVEVEMAPQPKVRARIGFGNDSTALEAGLGDGSEHGGWRHVVITYNNVAKQLRIYVNADNGNPDAELGGGASPVFYVANASMPLRIAAGQTNAGAVGLYFKGRIDEVALYRTPLDGASIRNHFLAGTSLPS
jgi:hypothetical protein